MLSQERDLRYGPPCSLLFHGVPSSTKLVVSTPLSSAAFGVSPQPCGSGILCSPED